VNSPSIGAQDDETPSLRSNYSRTCLADPPQIIKYLSETTGTICRRICGD